MGSLISVDGWLSKWTGTVIAAGDSFEANGRYAAVYIMLAIGSAALTFTQQVVVVYAVLRAGRKLHDQMLRALLRSPISFFDSTPIGRIINRFSKDQTSVDEELPDALTSLLAAFLRVGGEMRAARDQLGYTTSKLTFQHVVGRNSYNSCSYVCDLENRVPGHFSWILLRLHWQVVHCNVTGTEAPRLEHKRSHPRILWRGTRWS
eukprot:Plantae.Rhodophyta-Purpureofilum_apyrenoidigerum.ctg45070.p1 GENE.Plantae.Rhodophyta-Purpureofilum_apyrenoidigerum.ctg45070~~Plantae.Rhodophyta-Purpureofilum_apyrenoidigerum.ctg45070.p1  ORF type:complete len:205 (+),score=6.56 Plantae.Rhodophyta-Purpureofilum_apyrenoidigerum.ctg45070:286-900(+)